MVRLLSVLLVSALAACAGTQERKPSRLRLSAEMRASTNSEGLRHSDPIVVRLQQPNQATVVLEVPIDRSAGEVRIPLGQGTVSQRQTGADIVAANATLPATNGANKSAYLQALSRVNQLYADKRFDTALIEVESLEKEFPKDARLLSMKGSLLIKLGDKPGAVKAWRRALELNPDDEALGDALEGLEEEP